MLASILGCLPAIDASALTFTVNSPADIPDANALDNACGTAPGNNVCTLRAAIEQANGSAGPDVIILPSGTYILSRPGIDDVAFVGDLDIIDSVTIVGGGADSTIIDGNGNVIGDRVIEISACIGNAPPSGGVCPGGSVVVAEISGVTVTGGRRTSGIGGGIFSRGTLRLVDCAFTNNSGPLGGAVSALGPTTITRCAISGNESISDGGGIDVENATLKVVNTTISGNFAMRDGGGLLSSGSNTELFNTTIANNTANSDDVDPGTGGGIRVLSGTTILSNSIVAGNIHLNEGSDFNTFDDCAGTLSSSGFNIVTVVTGCTVSGISSANPMLGPLQRNGGPTKTHALPSGSPAIDAGNPGGCVDEVGAALTTDQRGELRPFGTACDLGAFERGNGIFKDSFES